MPIFAAFFAGLVLGGGLVGLWLSKRWQKQVKEAESSLKSVAEQHKQQVQKAKDAMQKIADLEYQLSEANKSVRYLEGNRKSE